jgi:hypothetical protein
MLLRLVRLSPPSRTRLLQAAQREPSRRVLQRALRLTGVRHSALAADLRQRRGPARRRGRSSTTANQYVQAERGVAYSEDGDEVEFVEVFPPRSLEAYLEDIYRDPGEFIN